MEVDPEFSHSGNPRLGQRLYAGFPVLSDPVLKITQAHLSRTRESETPSVLRPCYLGWWLLKHTPISA